MAARHGISQRYFQVLFEERGVTFTQLLIEQRLLRVFRLLTEPTGCRLRIGDVSNASGFSDISYFHRSFRRRFGETPGGVQSSVAMIYRKAATRWKFSSSTRALSVSGAPAGMPFHLAAVVDHTGMRGQPLQGAL